MVRHLAWAVTLAAAVVAGLRADEVAAPGGKPPIRVLFLGDNDHHRPAERFRQLEPVLASRGIKLVYTDKLADLAPATLSPYDGLLIYANHPQIEPDEERALLDFVAEGKGLIAIHSASYCFQNSPKFIALVGAQFARHGTGTFRTTLADNHPLLRGFEGFASWDETYVHTKHNLEGRTVLEYRVESETREPWTWVRTHGKGRVFYTAWGHDARTWRHAGFQNLVERGSRWATGGDPSLAGDFRDPSRFPVPEMTPQRKDVAPFEYVDVGQKIPNYVPGKKWGEQAAPKARMQAPLSAAESLKHMVVPKGFHVELFAAEPDLGGKPIAMNWDERGRLWVAETFDYPNELRPRGVGRDRIRICEDTDGDGRADKFTVFAEELSIPTGLTFSRGGVIVFEDTRTVFLRDRDGDDVADERNVLFGTWGLGDTHGGPSNLQYGLDNWLWAMQGYNSSRLEVGGETHQFRQGFLRFKPDGGKLEFIRSTDNNTWGLSEEGLVFGSTANHNPSVYMPIANRYYEAVRGWTPSLMLGTIADSHLFKALTDQVRQVDHFGGYTAAAGHALYTARRYPQEYWNRVAFVNEPTGHLVGAFVLDPDGSGFRSSNSFNLLGSDDEWTAPIMAEVGPDGNVWVIDWYNYIVQHNPTPIGFKTGKGAAYETDLRDKTHGRIVRVVYDGPQPLSPQATFSLAGASPEKLVATLRDSNLFWRRHAQRLLVERGKLDVLRALVALVRDPTCDAIGLNTGAIHALWTLDGLGSTDGRHPEVSAALSEAMRHPSAGVRRNAAQVVSHTAQGADAILQAGLLADSDPRVRLAACLALADAPPMPAAGEAIVAAFVAPQNLGDRWILEAATCAAAHNSDAFLRGLPGIATPSDELVKAAAIVAEHRARFGPHHTVAPLVAGLAESDVRLAEAVVLGLARGWPKDRHPRLEPDTEEQLLRISERLSPERRATVARLAVLWGSESFKKSADAFAAELLAVVRDGTRPDNERVKAAGGVMALRPADGETVRVILDSITPRASPELAVGLLRTLQSSESDEAGRQIVARIPGMTPAARSSGIGLLLSRPAWTTALLDEAERGKILIADLSLEQREALAAHPDLAIRRRAGGWLKRGGALPSADRRQVIADLLPLAKEKGDAAAGKLVFLKHCSKCHVHGSDGQRVGPDLTGMAVHPKEEMLGNIVDPSRSVEGNFRVYTVTTTAGQVLTGLLASESKTAIELFDGEGRKTTLLRDDVEELVASNKSLMPDGFEKQLGPQELTDLLEFLSSRGKYLPLPIERAATAVSTRGMFYRHDAEVERLIFADWKPKIFAGVPFQLVDPGGDRAANVILFYGPRGEVSAKMPKQVSVPCNARVKAVHLLSGVSGWGHPLGTAGSVSLIVRLHYDNSQTEDHVLKNGEHFADYSRRVDVPGSQFAFDLAGRQIRYLKIEPRLLARIERIEFVKGPDDTAPVVMAVTVESPDDSKEDRHGTR